MLGRWKQTSGSRVGVPLVEAVYLAAQEGASKFHRAPSLVRLPRDIEIL
jgi:hypothetical protein